jgi:hypothetical protein
MAGRCGALISYDPSSAGFGVDKFLPTGNNTVMSDGVNPDEAPIPLFDQRATEVKVALELMRAWDLNEHEVVFIMDTFAERFRGDNDGGIRGYVNREYKVSAVIAALVVVTNMTARETPLW